jgi:cell division transport system ATP-binding protein
VGVIDLEGVSLRYAGGPAILHDVNLELAQGDLRFLTGPSGAGKSTLLRLLFLALKPDKGIARIFNANVGTLGPHDRALLRRRLGVVFQDFRLLGHMSVFDNVALPLRAAGQRAESYQADVNDMLDWIGLKSRAHDLPDTLSGGEKQRVAIARAVVTKPQVILADEPTGNVDPAMARRLLRLFVELNKLGSTVLMATHDVELIQQAGGAALHLENGTLEAA